MLILVILVQDQPVLHRLFQASLGYIVKPSIKIPPLMFNVIIIYCLAYELIINTLSSLSIWR